MRSIFVSHAGGKNETEFARLGLLRKGCKSKPLPVPDESPPKVVRTQPARRSPRVPLNIRVKVIFTEPVSAPTVTSQTVRLLLNGQPVPASVSLSVDALQAEVIPDQPLQAATAYVISVTTGVLDLAGDPLEQEFQTDMTTAPLPLPGRLRA